MIIGTVFLGRVKKFKSQQIQTKFFMLGIPLFPTGDSILVTSSGYNSRQGIPLKLHSESVLAGYGRIFVLIACIVAFAFEESHILAVLLAALAIFLFAFYGRSTEKENEIRSIIGDFTNVYAMPEWMERGTVYSIYNQLSSVYESRNRNWMTDIKQGNVLNGKLAYAIALLYASYDPSEENLSLKEKAAALYENEKVSSPAAVA